ncbi:MAG TPA: hypothetical protein VEJ87_06860 [Acidimicrobiales bacterium]|nr:hypothetical protein [Acidimicrobiales bacterium]
MREVPSLSPPTAPSITLALPRSSALTDVLLEQAPAGPSAREVEVLRADLVHQIANVVRSSRDETKLTLDSHHVLQAMTDPGACSPDPTFMPTPKKCRRAIGGAAVERCLRGRDRNPSDAVRSVVEQGLESSSSEPTDNAAVSPWWADWYRGLSSGAKAVVCAEAITWGTNLWTALDWDRFERPPVVSGRAFKWECASVRRVTLRARADVRLQVGDRPAFLLVGNGVVPPQWRTSLGFPALVCALSYAERAVPGRVVGIWPAAGQVRTWTASTAALREVADAAVSAVSTWARV